MRGGWYASNECSSTSRGHWGCEAVWRPTWGRGCPNNSSFDFEMRMEKEELPWATIRFEWKTQSSQTFDFCCQKVLAFPRVKKAMTCARLCSLTKQHHNLNYRCFDGALRHTFVMAWGEFTPTLEDVASLTLLPMFREVNAIRIALKERIRWSWSAWKLQ